MAPGVVPILEVPPHAGDPIRDAYAFIRRAQHFVPRGMTIAVDVRHLDRPAGGRRTPMRDIAEDLAAWGVPMLPVIHPQDDADRLADAHEAAEAHTGRTVVRLGVGLDDEDAEARLGELCRRAGPATGCADLVLDFAAVRSVRDVGRAEPVARKCLSWAQRHPWESVTLVSGAMPATLTGLPTNIAVPVPRHDWALWRRISETGVRFGDYAVAHPGATGNGWSPLPSLRYAHDDVWWIYRWSRDGNGNDAMYDLCRSLVASDHWPADGAGRSWGDAEIARRARGAGGPGNPTNWRAWGTSHHLAHVLRSLA